MSIEELEFLAKLLDVRNEKKPNYCGIEGVKFIYHNSWADPELYYRGEYFNLYDIEDSLYADYQEDVKQSEFNGDFADYVREHDYMVIELLENLRELRRNVA